MDAAAPFPATPLSILLPTPFFSSSLGSSPLPSPARCRADCLSSVLCFRLLWSLACLSRTLRPSISFLLWCSLSRRLSTPPILVLPGAPCAVLSRFVMIVCLCVYVHLLPLFLFHGKRLVAHRCRGLR